MTDSKITSYTAANSLPLKIFRNQRLMAALNKNKVPYIHAQVIPTNKCNLNCKFCSCGNRDKGLELSLKQIETLCKDLRELGSQAVTITGGGEPLMHKGIHKILQLFYDHDIKIGLVTNGLLLGTLTSKDFRKITWCRVSCADDRSFSAAEEIIEKAVYEGRNVDWAFSYVVGAGFNPENLNNYIRFANEHKFTHVRVVTDLLDILGCPDMDWVKAQVTEDDSIVIYQGRKRFDPGQEKCWISLLKPTIGADGYVYPCCGAQYAHEAYEKDMPVSMRMGRIENIKEIIAKQIPFNGLQCYRCYYKNYNDILGQMLEPINHVEFV